MTMHLAHPALTTTGRRRAKQKFRSSAEKKLAQELASQWDKKMKEFATLSTPVTNKKIFARTTQGPKIPQDRTTRHIPSVDSNHKGAVGSPEPMMYTGNKVLGIAVQHKSCLQPIFSQESAVDSAHMRR
jgi:hypothetical protein